MGDIPPVPPCFSHLVFTTEAEPSFIGEPMTPTSENGVKSGDLSYTSHSGSYDLMGQKYISNGHDTSCSGDDDSNDVAYVLNLPSPSNPTLRVIDKELQVNQSVCMLPFQSFIQF